MTYKQKILDFLINNPQKTNKEIAEGTNIKADIRYTLYRMKKEGLILKDKDNLWTVDKGFCELKERDKEILNDVLEECYAELKTTTVTKEKIKLAEIIVRIIFSGKRG